MKIQRAFVEKFIQERKDKLNTPYFNAVSFYRWEKKICNMVADLLHSVYPGATFGIWLDGDTWSVVIHNYTEDNIYLGPILGKWRVIALVTHEHK